MNCDIFQDNWHDWRAGQLPEPRAHAQSRHLAGCGGCRRYDEEMRVLLVSLQALPKPQPPVDLAQRLFADLERPRRRRQQALGLAASVVLAVAVSFWQLWPHVETPVVALSAEGVSEVQLLVASPRDLEGVVFTVELPPGASLHGYPGQKVLSWTGNLSAGDNGLTLPIVPLGRPDGDLVTRIEHRGLQKELRVKLRAASEATNG